MLIGVSGQAVAMGRVFARLNKSAIFKPTRLTTAQRRYAHNDPVASDKVGSTWIEYHKNSVVITYHEPVPGLDKLLQQLKKTEEMMRKKPDIILSTGISLEDALGNYQNKLQYEYRRVGLEVVSALRKELFLTMDKFKSQHETMERILGNIKSR